MLKLGLLLVERVSQLLLQRSLLRQHIAQRELKFVGAPALTLGPIEATAKKFVLARVMHARQLQRGEPTLQSRDDAQNAFFAAVSFSSFSSSACGLSWSESVAGDDMRHVLLRTLQIELSLIHISELTRPY